MWRGKIEGGGGLPEIEIEYCCSGQMRVLQIFGGIFMQLLVSISRRQLCTLFWSTTQSCYIVSWLLSIFNVHLMKATTLLKYLLFYDLQLSVWLDNLKNKVNKKLIKIQIYYLVFLMITIVYQYNLLVYDI